jgi:hypothetical protein
VIYPATQDIKILQNATWRGIYRATQERKVLSGITIGAGVPTFIEPCHGLVAGDKVVITGGTDVPCGVTPNTVYFVIATGLTPDEFRVSATLGGISISASGSATGIFYVAKPLDITGYAIDADLKDLIGLAQVATFTATVLDAVNGAFALTLAPAITVAIEIGRYGYDVSLTSGGGERYYWVTGIATVEITYSRN